MKAELKLSIISGLLQLGKCDEALELILNIDESLLKSIAGASFIYTILHLECLYELGEIIEAERIYEKEMPLLALDNVIDKRFVQIMIAERLYFLGRYEEDRELLKNELDGKNAKITRLNILYKLVVIDEELNDFDLAKEKFKEIRSSAPKLWIAEQSKLRLAKYEKY